MQNATKRDYPRHVQTRAPTRKPAWIDPLLTFMVRRGSTVRVRQRALQKRCTWRFFFRIDLQILEREAGMEPFMEPSGLNACGVR
jgi:hypothetical protein